MKKFILLALLFLIPANSIAQETIIGFIVDEYGEPIPFVSVYQKNSQNSNLSSTDGSFHVSVEIQHSRKLIFTHSGYELLEYNLDESPTQPLRITLKKRIDRSRYNQSPYNTIKPGPKQWHLSFYFDWMSFDFQAIENEVGIENIDFLNKQDLILGAELGFTNNRFYHGYTAGLFLNTNTQNDSIKKEVNKSLFGFQLGYKIIDSKVVVFSPNAGIRWYKYRLLNYDKESKIPFNQFLNQRRDLDLRFNHAIAHLGANLSFKIKEKNKDKNSSGYWTFGIYANYLFKIHPHPIIYTKRNRLTSNKKINLQNLNIGVHFTGNIYRNNNSYNYRYQ